MGRSRSKDRPFGSIVTMADLRRPNPHLAPRSVMLIVCEGSKTEPIYFDEMCKKLCLTSVEVEIIGKNCGSAPMSVVNAAIERREERAQQAAKSVGKAAYDRVWCVMDVEKPGENQTLAGAVEKARVKQLKVALSNPCFEFWILLHFCNTSKPFHDCSDVISEIKKFFPKYKKGESCFARLDSKTSLAIRFAKQQFNLHSTEKWPNPSTSVYEIVEELQKASRKPQQMV